MQIKRLKKKITQRQGRFIDTIEAVKHAEVRGTIFHFGGPTKSREKCNRSVESIQ